MSEPVPQLSVSTPAAPEDRVRAFVEIFGQKWVNEFNDPVVFRSCSLSSKAALQFYRRDFAEMSRLLFADTMYRRRAGFDQAVLDAFIEAATKKLAEVQALIAVQCQRLVKVCESNGQPTDAAYVHQQQMLVPIISPPCGVVSALPAQARGAAPHQRVGHAQWRDRWRAVPGRRAPWPQGHPVAQRRAAQRVRQGAQGGGTGPRRSQRRRGGTGAFRGVRTP